MTTDPTAYVDRLFARYEPNAELDDFKAEVLSNLLARIEDLTGDGMPHEVALDQAIAELGDIDAVATEMSVQRTRDVYAQMYLHHKVRPSIGHAIAYVVLGAWLVMGLLFATITAISGEWPAAIGIAIGGVALPIGGFVVVGLTQETSQSLPLPLPRAIGYGGAVFLMLAGLALGSGIAVNDPSSWTVALAAGVPVLILGVGIAAVLGMSQTNRKKPWVLAAQADSPAFPGGSEGRWARFGLYFAATLVLMLTVFVAVGATLGWGYGALVFPLGIVFMFNLIAWAMKGEPQTK